MSVFHYQEERLRHSKRGARACCLVPSEQEAHSPPARPAAPVLCRTFTLGGYLHGPVAWGSPAACSLYAIPQQILSITCLHACTGRACARRGKVCQIPSLPAAPCQQRSECCTWLLAEPCPAPSSSAAGCSGQCWRPWLHPRMSLWALGCKLPS